MWTRNVMWVALAVALLGGCGSEDEGSEDPGGTGGGGAGGAGGAAGAAGTGGTGGGGTGGTGGGGAGGTGGTGGITLPECPADPAIATCGTETCAPITGPLTMACYQVCCTADMKCGTKNAAVGTECMETMENTSMCPNETVGGTMVMGCCVDEATNECGIMNPLGFGDPCVGRTSAALQIFMAGLERLNCDGTAVMGGAGGMGGEGGMGGMGGMGGADPDAGM